MELNGPCQIRQKTRSSLRKGVWGAVILPPPDTEQCVRRRWSTSFSHLVTLPKLISLLALCVWLASCASQDPVQNGMRRARHDPAIQAYIRNDWDKAIAIFSERISEDANNIDAYNYRSKCYANKGMYDQAISDYTQLIVLDPGNASFHYANRGGVYVGKGDYVHAIEDSDKAIEVAPDSLTATAAKQNKALALAKSGHLEDSLVIYDQLIREMPSVGQYMMRGQLFFQVKDYDKAIADYTEAIELNKGKGDVIYEWRGTAYRALRRYDDAIRDFNKAIRCRPDIGSHYYEKAVTYDEWGRYKEALDAYQAYLSLPAQYRTKRAVTLVLGGVLGLLTSPDTKPLLIEEQQKRAVERVRMIETMDLR